MIRYPILVGWVVGEAGGVCDWVGGAGWFLGSRLIMIS